MVARSIPRQQQGVAVKSSQQGAGSIWIILITIYKLKVKLQYSIKEENVCTKINMKHKK